MFNKCLNNTLLFVSHLENQRNHPPDLNIEATVTMTTIVSPPPNQSTYLATSYFHQQIPRGSLDLEYRNKIRIFSFQFDRKSVVASQEQDVVLNNLHPSEGSTAS